MKSILISIKPKWVAKILNGEKTIEIRKRFPKDYRGWVYIYCTKDNDKKHTLYCDNSYEKTTFYVDEQWKIKHTNWLNGKVIAKFRLNKVEEIKYAPTKDAMGGWKIDSVSMRELLTKSCLFSSEISNYLNGKKGYAWHITNLEIFDKPKELSEFYKGFNGKYYKNNFAQGIHKEKDVLVQPIKSGYEYTYPLTKAPQSWCYVEELKN